MKRSGVVHALVVGSLLLVACGDDDDGGSGRVAAELEGRTFLTDHVVEDDAERSLVDGTMLRVEFGDGEIRGHAGCNHLRGTVVSTVDGVLVVDAMGRTEMGCPPELEAQDDWVVTMLTSSPAWALDDDRLVLESDGTQVTLIDRRVADPDQALEGTIWRVESLVEGTGDDGSVAHYPSDEAWLLFTDGRLDGYTGCNSLSGSYTLDGDTLSVDDLSQTDVFCGQELGRAEEHLVSVLERAEVRIEARSLSLTAGDSGLGLRADGA